MVSKEISKRILVLGLTTVLVGVGVMSVSKNLSVIKAHWTEQDLKEQETNEGMQFGFGMQNKKQEYRTGPINNRGKRMHMMQGMMEDQEHTSESKIDNMRPNENANSGFGNRPSKFRALFRLETKEQVREYREKLREQQLQYRKIYRQKVGAEIRQEIQKLCGNIQDKQKRRDCVQKVMANHIDEVVQRVAQKFDKLVEHINNSKVIPADTKTKIVAKLNDLKAQAQQIEDQIKSGKITAREGAKQLRELSKQARDVVKQVRVSLTARVYRRLQRVVNITSRVYEKVKDKVSSEASVQMQVIIEQLKALIEAGQPQDVSVAKQEMLQIRRLVKQFVQLVRNQLNNAKGKTGQK